MNERSFLKIVVTPARLKFEGQDPLANFIAAGRTDSGIPIGEVTDSQQPLGRFNRWVLNFTEKLARSRPVNVGLSAAALSGVAVVSQAFHENDQEVAYAGEPPVAPLAAEQIAGEGVFPVILPTLRGAGEISPQDAIDHFFNGQVANGFKITSIWVASNGTFHGYYPGAPKFVNSQPESLTVLDPQAIVYLVVGKGEKPFVEGISKQMGLAYLAEINAAKRLNGLPEVSVDSRLQTSAEKYARLLYNNPAWVFDRTGINVHTLDGYPWDRALREGYPTNQVGEVMSYDFIILDPTQEAKRLVPGLLESTTHRDILLNRDYGFTDVGVGCFLGNGVVDPKTGKMVLRLVCVADFGHR